jgi:diguanylate cyclase (GGDEF)-like protein
MLSNPIPTQITHSLVQEHIERSSLRLKFAPALEKFFEKETGPERCRYLFRMGIIVLVIFQLVLYPQKLLLGDEIFPRLLLIQWGIATPLDLVFKWTLRRNPRPLLREFSVVVAAMLSISNCVVFTLISHSPDRWAMLQLLAFAFLYITAMQQVRFLPTIVACAAICLVEIFLTLRLPQYNGKVFLACALITFACAVFAVYGNYMSEKQTRQSYLLALLSRIQNTELNWLSDHDPLTGLGNRRLLLDAAEAAAKAPGQILHAVMMVDIDHFKDLNDMAGHIVGDQCLVRIASLIQSQLRKHEDHAFRYGGDEFIILLEHTPRELAYGVAERIRTAIEAAGIPNPGEGANGKVTVSIGGAVGTESIDTLLANADLALFSAKEIGRNRVLVKGGADPDPGNSHSPAATPTARSARQTTRMRQS